MASRKKNHLAGAKREETSVAPGHDPREPVEKVICGLCGTQVLEVDTDPYLDAKTGQPRLRCADCRNKNHLAGPKGEEECRSIGAQNHLAGAKSEETVTGNKNHLAATTDSVDRKELKAARAAQFEAERKLALTIRETQQELDAAKREYQKTVAHLEEQLRSKTSLVEQFASRVRDYEVLLGFDPPATEERLLVQIQPWMLEIAAAAARRAPDALDEKKLTVLIVDAITEAYAQRTLEAAAVVQALTETAAGGPLFEMERAIRLVADLIAHYPEKPAEDRKDKILAAWEQLNLHTRSARAQVEEEIRRLMHIESIERFESSAVAQVVLKDTPRPVAILRPTVTPVELPPVEPDDDEDGF